MYQCYDVIATLKSGNILLILSIMTVFMLYTIYNSPLRVIASIGLCSDICKQKQTSKQKQTNKQTKRTKIE